MGVRVLTPWLRPSRRAAPLLAPRGHKTALRSLISRASAFFFQDQGLKMNQMPSNREPRRYKLITRAHLDRLPQLDALDADARLALKAVATVLPFKVNNYVVDELIDWSRVPDDPIYQLSFPQPGMLASEDLNQVMDALRREATKDELTTIANGIRHRMNPHPAGQQTLNVPEIDGTRLPGCQHKYRETLLFFPSQGQTCHAYCTYCFRWAQFVGMDGMKFADKEIDGVVRYLRAHPEVTDVLFTGGDPLVMRTKILARYIDALLQIPTVRTIRLGTKSVAWWPQRFVDDADADDLLHLFERVVASGRHLALMGHYSHPVELSTPVAQAAVRRITDTGAVVRCQAPLIRHVNDAADAWATMWRLQVRLGAVPYYMFVERDTGPKHYFEVPLQRALSIFNDALAQVSGLGRTVRGPSMSATPGKVLIDGVAEVAGEKVFVLKILQGRDPRWTNRVFFAKYDPKACWLNDLKPAFGQARFFFEDALGSMESGDPRPWAQRAFEPIVADALQAVVPAS